MIPPEAVLRFIVVVGPSLLVGIGIHSWKEKRRTEQEKGTAARETMRVRCLQAAMNYHARPTPDRLAILNGRLARLGIKGSISHKEMLELIEYLDFKDIEGAAKRFSG